MHQPLAMCSHGWMMTHSSPGMHVAADSMMTNGVVSIIADKSTLICKSHNSCRFTSRAELLTWGNSLIDHLRVTNWTHTFMSYLDHQIVLRASNVRLFKSVTHAANVLSPLPVPVWCVQAFDPKFGLWDHAMTWFAKLYNFRVNLMS